MAIKLDEEHLASIRAKLREQKALPTLPGIVSKLTQMVADPKVSADRIGQVIAKDQILAAKILKLVNSAFYGFPGRISTVSNAVILLGFNVIRSLVLSASIFEAMEKSLVGLWEHSLGCAALSNVIARRIGLNDPEEVSTAGLLHDIGKVVIRENLGNYISLIDELLLQKPISLYEAEREILQTDHAEIGKRLGHRWHLPDRLTEPISYHHEPSKSKAHFVISAVVHVADILVRARGFGSGGDKWVPRLDGKAWDVLRLSEGELPGMLLEAEDVLMELKGFSFEIQNLGEKCRPALES
ncbi:MAG: HDOD domain-containing protein [Pseudomonadota bacterium]